MWLSASIRECVHWPPSKPNRTWYGDDGSSGLKRRSGHAVVVDRRANKKKKEKELVSMCTEQCGLASVRLAPCSKPS